MVIQAASIPLLDCLLNNTESETNSNHRIKNKIICTSSAVKNFYNKVNNIMVATHTSKNRKPIYG